VSLLNVFFGIRGRIGRGQWWLFQIAVFIGMAVVHRVARAIGMPVDALSGPVGYVPENSASSGAALVVLTWAIALSWISVVTTIKRLHDRDKSGWWYLINFIPGLGFLWIVVECGLLSGTPEENEYDFSGRRDRVVAPSSVFDPAPGPQSSFEARLRQSGSSGAASPRLTNLERALREEAQTTTGRPTVRVQPGFGRRIMLR